MNTPAPDAATPPRWRRHARRVAWGSAALAIASVLLLSWLLYTIAGRDLLLARIVAALPADATLTWSAAEGPAAGPLTLRAMHFAYHGTDLRAAEVMLDPALQPLLWRKLRLDALRVRGAQLLLPPSTEPFRLPRWPQSLPKILPPLGLQADHIQVDGLRVRHDGRELIAISRLRGGIDADTGRLHIERLQADSDRGRFLLDGDYLPREDYRTRLRGAWHVPAQAGRPAARLGVAARGSLAAMYVEVRGVAPGPVHASAEVHGRAAPQWKLRAEIEGLDLALFTGEDSAPAWYGALRVDGDDGLAKLQGNARRGDF